MLVRAPPWLEDALVRETARRRASLNDVAVGLLADAFAVPYTPTGRRSGLPGRSPVVLLRMPETLKREIQAEAFRTSTNTNDLIVRTLADGLGIPTSHEADGRCLSVAAAERTTAWLRATARRTATLLAMSAAAEARGNPVRIRDCPAAVSGNDSRQSARTTLGRQCLGSDGR